MLEYDIIIPVAFKDCFFLKRTIKYIIRNLAVDKIFIITNKINNRYLSSIVKRNPQCILIDEDKLLPNLSLNKVKEYLEEHQNYGVRTGWLFQQYLKMAFAISQYCTKEYYLSWDADTLPLRRIEFFHENHPLFTMKKEYHEPYFQTINKLLGLGIVNKKSYISEHMIFNAKIMKNLIRRIEESSVSGSIWYYKIINAMDISERNAFSEFETYGNYCLNYEPELYEERSLNTFRLGGYIAGRFISDKKLKYLAFDLDTISIELTHYPSFPLNILCYLYSRIIFLGDNLTKRVFN